MVYGIKISAHGEIFVSGDRPSSVRRSFSRAVERRLGALDHVSLETLCRLQYGEHQYGLYLARCAALHRDRPTVLISAGMHGDEPAGVHACLHFLARVAPRFRDRFNFVALPCANPSGFEADTLETMSGQNLNRLFGTDSSQPEIVAIEQWLANESPDFRMTVDLHETIPNYRGEGFVESDNPRACYLYETTLDKERRIGRELIDSLPTSMPVCRWPRIYLDDNSDGVISYPEACHNPIYGKGTTFDAYLNGRHTEHSLTTETPTVWELRMRIAAHLLWLEKALELLA